MRTRCEHCSHWATAILVLLATTVAAVLPLLLPDTSPGARAQSGGMIGYSGNPAQGGQSCNRCHSGGVDPHVTLAGPQRVRARETHGYTLTLSGGQAVAGGFNVSADAGVLGALLGAPDVRVLDGELTHAAPKPADDDGHVHFRFVWTAPGEVPNDSDSVRLFGAGNSVDVNGSSTGDRAALASLTITVVGPDSTPTATISPTVTVSPPVGPTASLTPSPTRAAYETVFADLNNPHGLFRAGGRDYLLAEGGTGEPVAGEFAPGNGDGRVLRLGPLAQDRAVLITGLTNAQDPAGGIVGANHAIQVYLPGPTVRQPLLLVAQSGGPGHLRPGEAARILRVGADGVPSTLADTLAFERVHNPGGESGPQGIDSNPWRMLYDGDRVFITDAGANDVLTMDPVSGELSLYAVFAPIASSQAIPTGIARQGNVTYVALLGAMFPTMPAGQVRRLEDSNGDGDALDAGENSLLIDGLAMPTDLAIGPRGHLYILEMSPGHLSVVHPGCWSARRSCVPSDRAVVARGLTAGTAFTWDDNFDALVTSGPRNPSGPSVRTDRLVRVPYESLRPPDGVGPHLYVPLGLRDGGW